MDYALHAAIDLKGMTTAERGKTSANGGHWTKAPNMTNPKKLTYHNLPYHTWSEKDTPKSANITTVNIKGEGEKLMEDPRAKVECSPHLVSTGHTRHEVLEEE